MATWEDGPEYAPLQRPEQFSAPESAPLEDAPARPAPSAEAPLSAPRGFDAAADSIPLTSIGPESGPGRDPHRAFDTVSSLMTASSASAWTSAHSSQQWSTAPSAPDPRQPMHVAGQQGPQQPVPQPAPQQGGPQQFPAPGTQQWFSPDPSWSPPGVQAPTSQVRQVTSAVTAPALVCLALGLIPVLAPFCLVIAFALSRLGTRARRQIATGYAISIGVVTMVGLTALVSGGQFYDAISLPANLACIVMLIASPLLAQRHLASGAPPERRG